MRAACDLRPYADEQPRVVDRLRPHRGGHQRAAAAGPRARHRRRVDDARVVDPAAAGRHALDLGTGCGVQAVHLASPRPLGDRHRHLRAGAGLRPVQRRARRLDVGAACRGPARTRRRASGSTSSSATRRSSSPRAPSSARCTSTATAGGRRRVRAGPGASMRRRPRARGRRPAARQLGDRGAAPTWRERVGQWLDGTGLDAWVIQRDVQDPAQYAETWARDGGHQPGTRPRSTPCMPRG